MMKSESGTAELSRKSSTSVSHEEGAALRSQSVAAMTHAPSGASQELWLLDGAAGKGLLSGWTRRAFGMLTTPLIIYTSPPTGKLETFHVG